MDASLSDIHSILPLSVLEAMRNLDSPTDEEAAEYVDELLKKRLGLSDTVAAQIARYDLSVRRGRAVTAQEFEQILRLGGRRPDAALVFADAGRRAARHSLTGLGAPTRFGSRYLPRFLRRSIGFRAARRCLREVFAAGLSREGAVITAQVRHDLAVRATPDGSACGFFAAGIAELLRQLMSFDGAVLHPRCRVRGDERCEWRTTDAPARVA
jgi:predicted hydrocarbon binding protein